MLEEQQTYSHKFLCAQLWTIPQVNWDGRTLGCCENYWGDFGNAFEEGLEEGLNNEKIDDARRMVRGEAPAREGIPCTTCHHYAGMKQRQEWLTDEDIEKSERLYRIPRFFSRTAMRIINRFPFILRLYLASAGLKKASSKQS